jgi:hypothetical protein
MVTTSLSWLLNKPASPAHQPDSAFIACSLLVSQDPITIEQVVAAKKRLAISTEVCSEAVSARQALNRRKFEAVTVDFGLGEQAPGILGEMRLSPSNRTAPAMAIVRDNSDLVSAFCAGTNFIFQRPLSEESMNRTLVAAYGLVVRERRRYFRCELRTRLIIRRADMQGPRCHTVNVSEGGLELSSAPPKLVPGVRVPVEFTLPNRRERFVAVCETCWRDHRGHAGLRFLVMALGPRCDLREWLAEKLEETLPESVAGRFRYSMPESRF